MIWKQVHTVEILNQKAKNTLIEQLGIEITEIGADYIKAKMPVDHRTRQPDGLLHGGASVALAESMGSFASYLLLEDHINEAVVGVEINANHLSAVLSGQVEAKASPVKLGRTIQVWNILITQGSKKVCVSRLTTMTIRKKQ
ncbi:MAG: hotdog fold thioesterase [Saprospiraceae bacterium]|nr:hotdog fold thioesterase [Saprospiraceae bacterium]